MLKDLVRLPAWALYVLIVTTAVLSLVILAKIWVPDLLDDTIFLKVVLTYVVVVASSAVISKISEYIKKMEGDSHV